VINTTSYPSTSNPQLESSSDTCFPLQSKEASAAFCCWNAAQATSCVIACCLLATVFKQTNSIGNRDKFGTTRFEQSEISGNQNRPDQGNRNRKKRWERKPNMDNINAVMESGTMQRETNTSISHRRHTKREKPFKSACRRTSTKLIVRYKSHAPYCFGNMQGLNSMNDIQLISIILR